MSNFSKDHPSIRVFAPPGGRSANIFGVPEPEVPMSNKKNHMESDIFGCKKDTTDSVPKPTHNMTNNIYGADREQQVQKSSIYSDKNKSTIFDEALPYQASNKPDRQRSNIFGPNEPVQSAPSRPVSEKYKSDIFGNGNNATDTKRQPGTRQGLRVGYNPINGEPYSTKDGLNSKAEQAETLENENDTVKTPGEENGAHGQNGHPKLDEQNTENGNAQVVNNTTENGNVEKPANNTQNGNSHESVDKPTNGHANGTNGHSTAKNGPTNVRVCHPPGGRSNGPLW